MLRIALTVAVIEALLCSDVTSRSRFVSTLFVRRFRMLNGRRSDGFNGKLHTIEASTEPSED